MDYAAHLLVMAGIFTILASALNLVLGYGGLLCLAHAAFYGLGAYATAILTTRLAAPFAAALGLSALLGVGAGTLIGFCCSRLKGDAFAVATFSVSVVFQSFLSNNMPWTNGPLGIRGIPPPRIGAWTLVSPVTVCVLVAIAVSATLLLLRRIIHTPFGRILMAVREDEALAASSGKNVYYYRTASMAVSAGLAALAGGLYAAYATFIDPSSFSVMESVLILSIVATGGAGSLRGPIVGVTLLVIIPEIFRFLGLPIAVAAQLRQLLYGLLLMSCAMFRPQGMAGAYSFGVRIS